ncbi:hypothetical protein [Fibrella aestuarina]|uniref:hypothetical protein n=1 Tax=Fibrella aestuarina TaxID=651143 RepID=UPI00059DDEF3|nr:hypothetical protein [Fibrella aestuarina]
MIRDKVFKTLLHSHSGYKILYTGQELEAGYKPDCVLVKDSDYIILESEGATNRKVYVGGMVKAAHFLQNDRSGKLIFVLSPTKNTKSETIARHLKPYLNWLDGKTNLRDVYVIDDDKYYSEANLIALDGSDFQASAFKV